MMGTLATELAGKKISTPEDRYWTDVEGDIENVNGVLKITTVRVKPSLFRRGEPHAVQGSHVGSGFKHSPIVTFGYSFHFGFGGF